MQIIDPENPTVVLDGEHHVIEKMDDNGKYYVDQIKDLNTQMKPVSYTHLTLPTTPYV